jgi:ABC-type spermidine/putrescine transport system permease subunit II
MTPAGPWVKILAALMAVAIVAPVLAVVPLAFSQQSFLIPPPTRFCRSISILHRASSSASWGLPARESPPF